MSVKLLDKRGCLVKVFESVREAYMFAMSKDIEEFSVFTTKK